MSLTFPHSYSKNVAISTKIAYCNRADLKLSNGTSPNSLSPIEVEIKWFESLTMAMSLMFPYFYTKNVAISNVITYCNRAYRECSDGTSPNSLSQIEVEIKGFESLTMAMSLTFPYSYTQNVAISIMMTYCNTVQPPYYTILYYTNLPYSRCPHVPH